MDKISRCNVMDRLLDFCGPTIWAGLEPPTTKMQFLAGFAVSMGDNPGLLSGKWDNSFVETQRGTGSFSGLAGGSLIALLQQNHQHNLSDKLIAQIFKQDTTSTAIIEYRGTRSNFTGSSKYASKLCDPISLLDALRNVSEHEVRRTRLSLDLFNLERLAIPILNRLHVQARPMFERLFGAQYQERKYQLPWLASRSFMAFAQKPLPNGTMPTADDEKEVLGMLLKAFKAARDDTEQALARGMCFGLVPDVDPIIG